jgi:hypothetical protein
MRVALRSSLACALVCVLGGSLLASRSGEYQAWVSASWDAPPGYLPTQGRRALWSKRVKIRC